MVDLAPEAPQPLNYFSVVQLRHGTGKLLASIATNYSHQGGSGQQVVGAIEQSDDTSYWVIKPAHGFDFRVSMQTSTRVEDGHVIRLEHLKTGKNLHSHECKAPVTDQQEISCYGTDGAGDANDNWLIRSRDQAGLTTGKDFTLTHSRMGTHLHSHGDRFFDAGERNFQEVTGYSGSDENDNWQIVSVASAPEKVHVVPFASVSAGGVTHQFEKPQDLLEWLEGERARYSWVHQIPPAEISATLRNHIESEFNRLVQRATVASGEGDPSSLTSNHEVFSNDFAETYRRPRLILSDDPKFLSVLTLKNSDAAAAAHALAFFLGLPTESKPSALKGQFAAMFFEAGVSGRASEEASALQELRESIGKEFDEHSARMIALQTSATAHINDAQDSYERNNATFERLVETNTKDLESLKHTYDQDMAMKASVSYWTKKASSHRWKFRGFAAAALVFGGIVVVSLYWFLQQQIERTATQVTSAAPIAASATLSAATTPASTTPAAKPAVEQPALIPPWWEIGTVILIATFGIWLVRVCVQLLYSHAHLAADAEERSTMIQTYLAMLRETQLPLKEEHRLLILQSLFRPGTTGVVKDDGSPSTWLDFIASKVSGK